MRYASIFFTVLIIWVAIVLISALSSDTNTSFQLYLITMLFTLMLFIFGFTRRK